VAGSRTCSTASRPRPCPGRQDACKASVVPVDQRDVAQREPQRRKNPSAVRAAPRASGVHAHRACGGSTRRCCAMVRKWSTAASRSATRPPRPVAAVPPYLRCPGERRTAALRPDRARGFGGGGRGYENSSGMRAG
jgi:hypothetical protein